MEHMDQPLSRAQPDQIESCPRKRGSIAVAPQNCIPALVDWIPACAGTTRNNLP